MWHSKTLTEDACLSSVERLFKHFAPLNEQYICPLAELFKGRLKSVFVFRSIKMPSANE